MKSSAILRDTFFVPKESCRERASGQKAFPKHSLALSIGVYPMSVREKRIVGVFFQAERDYIHFPYGAGVIILAAVCFALRKSDRPRRRLGA